MKLKHTPGPWEQNNIDPLIICKEDNEGYEFVAEVNGYEGINKSVSISNARIIAASPEMLEALIFEYDAMCQGCRYEKTCKVECDHKTSIKLLIEKATGLPIEEVLNE